MVGSLGSSTYTSASASEAEAQPETFVHTISEAGRLLPSSSRWNSIELDFNLAPQSSAYDSISSKYSKSYDYDIFIADRTHFKRFVYISVSIVFIFLSLFLLLHFLPHKQHHHGDSKNFTLAITQALTFFDAQMSGSYPEKSGVKFRGDSGMQDGNSSNMDANLVGGFYDSGNNIKFSFPTAYTITLLSWTVIEYHEKYDDIGELEHVKDIIKWGSDYLLRLFVPPNATSDPTILYSQVGSTSNDTKTNTDITCWQRPEDMSYPRPVSVCDSTASDLAAEIVAALSAASMVFKEDNVYSETLIKAAEQLFQLAAIKEDSKKQGTYTMSDVCGGEARPFYNSSGYRDELVWGGSWLFFGTGNISYLGYATDMFDSAEVEENVDEKGVFYWNNKQTANMVLLTRLRFFRDLGYPYETALGSSSNKTDLLMCSYLSQQHFNRTPGGLILMRPGHGEALQFAATASFLSKVYSDYLDLLRRSGGTCGIADFSVDMLRKFSKSQINYILGSNPKKMSYLVGFGDHYPTQVHHRSASIPYDGRPYSCAEGERWRNSKDPNPNIILGAMVAGPDESDNFSDDRAKPAFTEPTISSNAGLVAALVALHVPPPNNGGNLGIDQIGMFENIRLIA